MDERRSPFDLKAPGGRDGAPMRWPRRTPFPNVDDHLVEPEVTRDEMIGGRRVVAHPAKEPHADQHSDLDYVLRAHAAPGYDALRVDLEQYHQEAGKCLERPW